jgi:hypothetical protein
MKARPRTPKTTNKPIMRPLLHAYLVPPHCRASNKLMIAGRKKREPIKSSSLSCSFEGVLLQDGVWVYGRRQSTKKKVTPPRGKLI